MNEFWFGVIGVAIGAILQCFLDIFKDYVKGLRQKKIDENRKKLLQEALLNPPVGKEWRCIYTLMRIIGADRETTTALLIELGARGSESENDVWALIKNKPLRS
jgi:hypothetical protein